MYYKDILIKKKNVLVLLLFICLIIVLYKFGIHHAFAKSLVEDLDPASLATPGNPKGWILTTWQWSLGFVNSAIIAVLILIAFANILRLNLDTYAIKKALPGLILGVILANFSLLICRMLVDFSTVLIYTFLGNPKDLAQGLVNALGLSEAVGAAGIPFAIIGFIVAPGVGLGILIIALILLFLPAIGVLILAFLMYIRIAVIYLAVAISPLAFICLGIPPAKSVFTKWWSMFLNWVFMAPVVFFLLKIATLAGGTGDVSFTSYIIGLAMLYLAIMTPFKMGGAVMQMWGRVGSLITGTSKGGYARKAAGFGAKYLGAAALTKKMPGGAFAPNWLGKVAARMTTTKLGAEAVIQKRLGVVQDNELQRLSGKIARKEQTGQPLTPFERRVKVLIHRKSAESGQSWRDQPLEGLLSFLGATEDERNQTALRYYNKTIEPQDIDDVWGAMYALRSKMTSANYEERQGAQEAINAMNQYLNGVIGGANPVRLDVGMIGSVARAHPAVSREAVDTQYKLNEQTAQGFNRTVLEQYLHQPQLLTQDMTKLEEMVGKLNKGGNLGEEDFKMVTRLVPQLAIEAIQTEPAKLRNEINRIHKFLEAGLEIGNFSDMEKITHHVNLKTDQEVNIEEGMTQLMNHISTLDTDALEKAINLPDQEQQITLQRKISAIVNPVVNLTNQKAAYNLASERLQRVQDRVSSEIMNRLKARWKKGVQTEDFMLDATDAPEFNSRSIRQLVNKEIKTGGEKNA